jgi:hypothetical protein
MRAALAIAILASLFFSGCTMLREATQVAVALSKPPTEAQIDAQTHRLSQNSQAMVDQLKQIQASGRKPTQAEMDRLTRDLLSNKQVDARAPSTPPPPDQEISVNLTYAGYDKAASGKNLNFDFKALWGTYKVTNKQISMAARAGKGEANLDLGDAHLRIIPKIVSSTRGNYDVVITDNSGALVGRFNIAETGKQVDITQSPSKYDSELMYFHPERRLTGYSFYKAGTRKPEFGVIFVGKGWSYVENAKKPDLSKGYLFPEVDMVVLPKAWLDDHEMKDTCNTLKRGEVVAGGVCYS